VLYYNQFKDFNPLNDWVISKNSYASKIVWRARAILSNRTIESIELIAKRVSKEIDDYYLDKKLNALNELQSNMRNGELSDDDIHKYFDWDGGTVENGMWILKNGMEEDLEIPTENNCSEVDALKAIIETRDSCFFLPVGTPTPKSNEYAEGRDYELFAVMALWFVADALSVCKKDSIACDYIVEAMDALCYAEHLQISEALIFDAQHESKIEVKKIKNAQKELIEQFKKDAVETEQSVLARQASRGGKAKSEKYQPLKDFVYQLATERNWPSRRNLAMSIAPKVIAEGNRLNIPISKSQAVVTITNWLKDMGLPVNV